MNLGYLKRELWQRWEYLRHRLAPRAGGTPPHVVKRRVIREQAEGRRIFVETGTYMGDMVAAQRRKFARLHTIELSPELAARARTRFASTTNIEVHEGDSGRILPEVMAGISEPAVIWLDAHFSGGVTAGSHDHVPILDEVRVILEHPVKDHVVLIDDARLFNGTNGYPLVRQIEEVVERARAAYRVSVADDIIRLIPGD